MSIVCACAAELQGVERQVYCTDLRAIPHTDLISLLNGDERLEKSFDTTLRPKARIECSHKQCAIPVAPVHAPLLKQFHMIVAKRCNVRRVNVEKMYFVFGSNGLRFLWDGFVMRGRNMRAALFNVPVDILSQEQTLSLVHNALRSRTRLHHVALNVAKLVSLKNNAELKDDVVASDVVGIDGMGIALALRVSGHKPVTRVSGVDLMESVLRLCAEHGYRPFFLGATEEVVGKAVQTIKMKLPEINFAGFCNGYFTQEAEDEVLHKIRASQADCLFIGMPTPRKERLLRRWRDQLSTPFIMGVGGGFDVLAGKVQRAPLWMQKSGLEWAYRVYQEPRRMWWRYAHTNTVFLYMLASLTVQRLLGMKG